MTTALEPTEVTRLLEAAGLRAVPTGIGHGTVTAVSGGEGFEITTFRADVSTDGRRATVRFSTSIAEDAARRDFTMNAIYARPDGEVIDPLGHRGIDGRRVGLFLARVAQPETLELGVPLGELTLEVEDLALVLLGDLAGVVDFLRRGAGRHCQCREQSPSEMEPAGRRRRRRDGAS